MNFNNKRDGAKATGREAAYRGKNTGRGHNNNCDYISINYGE